MRWKLAGINQFNNLKRVFESYNIFLNIKPRRIYEKE